MFFAYGFNTVYVPLFGWYDLHKNLDLCEEIISVNKNGKTKQNQKFEFTPETWFYVYVIWQMGYGR